MSHSSVNLLLQILKSRLQAPEYLQGAWKRQKIGLIRPCKDPMVHPMEKAKGRIIL
jgi:hypothetical protein